MGFGREEGQGLRKAGGRWQRWSAFQKGGGGRPPSSQTTSNSPACLAAYLALALHANHPAPAQPCPAPPDPLLQHRVGGLHVGPHPVSHPAVHQFKGVARRSSSLQMEEAVMKSVGNKPHLPLGHARSRNAPLPAAPQAAAPTTRHPPFRAHPPAAAWPCAAPAWRPGRGHTPQTPPGDARSRAAAPPRRRVSSTPAPGLRSAGSGRQHLNALAVLAVRNELQQQLGEAAARSWKVGGQVRTCTSGRSDYPTPPTWQLVPVVEAASHEEA